MRISWQSLDTERIKQYCWNTYKRYGSYPSLRDIFYAFVDTLWPNTLSAYARLSRWINEKRFNGEIGWEMVRDGSGRELALSEDSHIPFSPEDIFKMACAEYKRAIENLPDPNEIIEGEIFRAKYEFASCYNKFWFGKWYEQPHKIVVLCEKEADYPVISSILEDKEISVGFTRGYSGKLLMYEVAKQFRYHKGIPVVLLLGDFDPSGQDIKANVGRDLERFGIKSILLPF